MEGIDGDWIPPAVVATSFKMRPIVPPMRSDLTSSHVVVELISRISAEHVGDLALCFLLQTLAHVVGVIGIHVRRCTSCRL